MADERASITTAGEAMAAAITLIERSADAGWSFVPGADLARLLTTEDDAWPLVLADGTVLGLACRDQAAAGAGDDAILALVQSVMALSEAERRATTAEARAAAAEEESRLDPLTGLANRRAWELTLVHEQARCRRTGGSAVVLVVDVDGLKEANDTHGHLAGDILLRTTAAALVHCVRESDVVARLGGDEFGVLAVDWEGPVPEALVGRVTEALAGAGVEASVGGAVPDLGESLLATFHRADEAMYEAKRARQGRPAALSR